MTSFRLLFIFVLITGSSAYLLNAETTINVDISALETRQPGENGAPFHFTTEVDGEVTVKAMFMTHWLNPRTNVVANPKATSIVIDGKGHPSTAGGEDFYGYMDGRVWPERIIPLDQPIWIQESVFLRKGAHTIEFRNGLMERDDSRSKTVFSYAGWMTAVLTAPDGSRPGPIGEISSDLIMEPILPNASISPKTQTIVAGNEANFTLISSEATKTEFSGTEGTLILNPSATTSVRPPFGNYVYSYAVKGKVRIVWKFFFDSEIWIYPPIGNSIEVTSLLSYDADQDGDYTFTVKANGVITKKTFHVDLPTTIATATLIVTAGPGPVGGPEVTEFSPVAASYTVTSGVAEGHTYERSWKAGEGWTAYLGRDGVAFRVVGQSSGGAVDQFEIQAKSPAKKWFTLTSGGPTEGVNKGPGTPVAQAMTARLGEVRQDKPLVPADPSLVGTWMIRARVRDTTGTWSPWAFEQPLNVIYPIKDVVKNAKTLPPAEDSDWFTASPEKAYIVHVIVP